jgi:hypothetical protein
MNTDYCFVDFANIMINDNTIADDSLKIYNIKELYDGYIKHLMVRKYNKEDILRYRMEAVVDYYIDFYGNNKNYDRNKLISQYKNCIDDSFDKKLNPPKCFLTMARREYLANELKEKMEYESCDINTHYKMINAKYKYYNDLNNAEKQKQTNDNDEYYDEYNENNYEDELNSSIYNSDDYDDYYCEYISEEDSEYYSDDY